MAPEQVLRGARMARFEAMYRVSVRPAWRVACAIVGNPDDAGDAVAEGFTRVLKLLLNGRLDGVVELKLYALSAVRSASLDICRARRREAPGALDEPATHDGPATEFARSFDSQLARTAFDQLPASQREVLWLTAVEGMPPRQVSEILGISANNVSQIAVRARASLLEHFIQAHADASPMGSCEGFVRNLGRYLVGRLSSRSADRLGEHLGRCSGCQSRLDQLDDLGLSLRRSALPLPLALAGVSWALRSWKPLSSPPTASATGLISHHIGAKVEHLVRWAESNPLVSATVIGQGHGVGRAAAAAAAALVAIGGASMVSRGPGEPVDSPPAGSAATSVAAVPDLSIALPLVAPEVQGPTGPSLPPPTPAPGAEAEPALSSTGGEVTGGGPDAGAPPTLPTDPAPTDPAPTETPAPTDPAPTDPPLDQAPPASPTPVLAPLSPAAGHQPIRTITGEILGPAPIKTASDNAVGPAPIKTASDNAVGSAPVSTTLANVLGPTPVTTAVSGLSGPDPLPNVDALTLGSSDGALAEVGQQTAQTVIDLLPGLGSLDLDAGTVVDAGTAVETDTSILSTVTSQVSVPVLLG